MGGLLHVVTGSQSFQSPFRLLRVWSGLTIELRSAVADEDVVASLLGLVDPVAGIEAAAEHDEANLLEQAFLALRQKTHFSPPFRSGVCLAGE